LAAIKLLVEKGQISVAPQKRIPIGNEEARLTIGKANPTIYAIVIKRQLHCYKTGYKFYFFED